MSPERRAEVSGNSDPTLDISSQRQKTAVSTEVCRIHWSLSRAGRTQLTGEASGQHRSLLDDLIWPYGNLT